MPTRPLIALVLLLFVSPLVHADEPTQPLNLLIVQTDEHNFRTLGCYRNVMPDEQAFIWGKRAFVETPHIDSIAARGALATSYYATSPVCTPSRASFFSGRYPQNTGSPANDMPLNNDVVTFGKVLQARGYATGYAGKWHLDGSGKPQWQPSRTFGFADNRFMFNRGHWKKFAIVDGQPQVAARNAQDKPTYNLDNADAESFSTDWLTTRAIEFIEQHRDEPFCYHLSLPDPHGPNTVRPPYDEMYRDLPIRPPLTYGNTELPRPGWIGGTRRGDVRFNAALMAKYFGMVRCIDDNVGRLLKKLDDLGLRERTAVVFTADHGDLCFEHGRLNKGNPYEGSARIPMIVYVPGRTPAGLVIEEALGTVDFAPTILSLLDAPAPAGTQGRDASALWTGDAAADWHDITFLRNAGPKPQWVAAVSDRFKLVVSVSDEPWLFDLQTDPDELINQHGRASLETVEQQLAQELLAYGKANQDPHVAEEKINADLKRLAGE
ncbi:sulfatase-like hydrolase/transferase [Roseimaritima ulvae]|uniref:Arylsulfatase n=1 Tax=Roseimaritima ulvae TaxID=980254 RepID=A0A5B9QNC3_9BACT|nr:sulfatase-like hydrolase/transferase [Roseimaritima ulvae]QEG40508.1 Arylsulfatase [Roseimaritima ulvae]